MVKETVSASVVTYIMIFMIVCGYVKPLTIMLPKTYAYVKIYDGQDVCMYRCIFWLNMMTY